MLSKFTESAEVNPILSKYFVLADLEIGNVAASNPGAEKYADKYKGHGKGVPLTILLDSKGKLIVNSVAPDGNNIGFPSEPGQIDWFMAMLKKGAPDMTDAERQTIEAKLRNKS